MSVSADSVSTGWHETLRPPASRTPARAGGLRVSCQPVETESAETDMARAHPHKWAARAAAISILTFMATLAAISLAPRASDAVAAWLRTPDVRTQTIALSAALPVTAPRAPAGAVTGSAAD